MSKLWKLVIAVLFVTAWFGPARAHVAFADVPGDPNLPDIYDGVPLDDLISGGAHMALFGPDESQQNYNSGAHDNGRGGNTFVNDPCLDPLPPDRHATVQSETSIAVLNDPSTSMGKLLVAGYNQSAGFYDNTRGLSGYAYSIDGGNTWIDGTGLPPVVKSHTPFPYTGSDAYEGDPVVVVDNTTDTFYYASIYKDPSGFNTVSVNRGTFQSAPPQGIESISNTRCLNDPAQTGIPDPPNQNLRIVWQPPVEAVRDPGVFAGDFLDKEWLYVDQSTHELYVTYTRFKAGVAATDIELTKSADGGRTWTPPTIVVPNLLPIGTFNQASQPTTTPAHRVIVTYDSRDLFAGSQRIEDVFSDNDGTTFSPRQVVSRYNPQGEPPGYNRGRSQILNAPFIDVNRFPGTPGFGHAYITYFSGSAPFAKAGNIKMSTSRDGGATWSQTQVNDDPGTTSHVFPSVQVNKNGYVYDGWLDRRNDPGNLLTDAWAAVSKDDGASFSPNREQTDIATNWFVRSDARPNFGDYNSSALLGLNQFVMIWADGRFRPPGGQTATPDTIFTIAQGLGS